jgi:hypothetical protein
MKNNSSGCDEYDTLVIGMEEARRRVAEAGKRAVGALFKKLFVDYPTVQAIGWTQYTPHFNDGDPCVFSMGEFYVSSKEGMDWSQVSRLYDAEESHGFSGSCGATGANKAAAKWIERVALDDIFETAFGDGVMVIATRDGFHINEYDHD